ncbi:hypothetical protein [Myxococcus eversor]|uniref:hypothetical protein n=1 Tax=Myxococcus eversor TaxID=2709661 RepID=UPI0013D37558|nr:hypothetical protein [Myxococcus eversor]
MTTSETRVRASWDAEDTSGRSLLETWDSIGREGWLTVARGKPLLISDDGTEIPPTGAASLIVGEYLEGGEYVSGDDEHTIDLYAVLTEAQLALVESAKQGGYVVDTVRSGLQGVDTVRESSLRRDLRAIAWLARKDGCTPAVLSALLNMQPRGAQAWLVQREEDGFEVLREKDEADGRRTRLRIPKASVRRVLGF